MHRYEKIDRYLLLIFIASAWFVSNAQQPVFPNDPYFDKQWGHHNKGNCVPRHGDGILTGTQDCDADLPEAWAITKGDATHVIAIIDTGVKFDHPELAGRFWENTDEIPGNGVDDDGNGYTDDYLGWDFVDDDGDPSFSPATSLKDHGTRMAGIVAANTDNGVGIAGVDWYCKVMILKTAITGSESDLLQNTISAIHYAADNGADFISLSYGFRLGYGDPVFTDSARQALEAAIEYALQRGVLTFAEPGNDDDRVKDYPAASPNTVAVGIHSPCNERKRGGNSATISCDNDTRESITPSGDRIAWGSNYGSHIDFVVPGVILPALLNVTVWEQSYGASMGPPFAAGVASLMLSVNPALGPAEIREIMQSTAVDLAAPGKDIETGYGRLNTFSAVLKAKYYCQSDVVLQDVCFANDFTLTATRSISTVSNVSLKEGVSGTLIAPEEIILSDGFTTTDGADFIAKLSSVSCELTESRNLMSIEINSEDHSLDDVHQVIFTPNPASDELKLKLPNYWQPISFSIYTIDGRLVRQVNDLALAIDEIENLQLEDGIYLYYYFIDGKLKTGKLLKR